MSKRLVKSESSKVCFGVAGGLSEYLNIDPVLVRLGFVGLAFCTGGLGFLAYAVLCVVMPSPEPVSSRAPQAPQAKPSHDDALGRQAPAAEGGEAGTASDRDQDALKKGFLSINFAGGLKALLDLDYEYKQLQLILDRKEDTSPLSVAYIPALAEETYRQGLSVVADALQLARAIHSSGKERLEAEIVVLEKEIAASKMDGTQAARVKIRQQTMATHKERLDLLVQQQLRVDELLHQCQRCEASLARTRIELAALRADSSGLSVDTVTERLQRTIDQAKEVTEELKRLGF